MKQGNHLLLKVADITLDLQNPRIAKFLETYEGKELKPEHIQMALGSSGDDNDSSGGTKYDTLKTSIETNGGIIQPIIVNRLPSGQLICIEGNTRVCLYQWFSKNKTDGNWTEIPAIVYDSLSQEEIDAIRLQAHLVGPRPWDPYSKAKYLAYLRDKEKMPIGRLADYCGGSKKAVNESIDAYADMETFFRPLCEEAGGELDPRKFSGFVELQRPNVKTAIAKAGYTVMDFAKWVLDEKFARLEHVRQLPAILKDQKARKIFEAKGSKEALKVLESPEMEKLLKEVSVAQLAQALSQLMPVMPWNDVMAMKDDPSSPTLQALQELKGNLDTFLNSLDQLSADQPKGNLSETLTHAKLVGVILRWVQANIPDAQDLCLFCDSPTILNTEKPQPIDGHYPDLFAFTRPTAITLLGEAKTIPDIDTKRSYNQIVSFLRFLSVSPGPRLVFAMPWQARATAKNIVCRARLEANAPDVPVVYLTD